MEMSRKFCNLWELYPLKFFDRNFYVRFQTQILGSLASLVYVGSKLLLCVGPRLTNF